MGGPRRAWLLGITAAWLAALLLAPAGDWHGLGGPTGAAILVLVAGMGAVATGSLDVNRGAMPAAVGLVLCAAAASAGFATPTQRDAGPLPHAGLARIEGSVVATSVGRDGRARAVLRLARGTRLQDGAPLPAGALLSVSPRPLPEGARVVRAARGTPYAPLRNPSPHPTTPSRFAIVGRVWLEHADAVRVLEHPWPAAWLWRARGAVRAALEATLDARSGAMARALVLGDDDALDDDTTAAVRDSGLLHVLAVSGLHVAVLAGLAVAALHALLLRTPLARRIEVRRLACAIGIPLSLVYAAFAGGAPSAWRAAITAAVTWSLVAAGRRPDALATTCAAALALAGADPAQATRPAFLLSVVATVAIVSEHGRDGEQASSRSLQSWTFAALRTSARATLATAPIILLCFGSMPVVGIVANLVLLPFGSVLLVQLSALHALVATLTPLSAPTGHAFTLCSEAFLAASAALGAALPPLELPPLDRYQAFVAACACAYALIERRVRPRLWVFAGALLALFALELRLRHVEAPRGGLRVTFLDVGQGDAALVDLPDGRLMLIDAGGNPGGGPDPGERALLPLLAARRRERIDLAVLTHPHPDHYGGFHALVDRIPIGELWDSGQAEVEKDVEGTFGEAATLLRNLRTRGTRVVGPRQLCERTHAAGGARIDVLWPCPRHDAGLDANDNSLVLRLRFGRRSFLFVGDAEALAERALVLREGNALRADVLKVGHHGSRTSTSPGFLAAVAPRIAVISAGASNRFGHPHPEVVHRLRAARVTPIELCIDGGTVVGTDGSTLWAHTWKGRKLLVPGR
jgi:competence protein ComEC